ncbi:MAG: hypothetical protein AAF235_07890 [Planctomycetota bacterium]
MVAGGSRTLASHGYGWLGPQARGIAPLQDLVRDAGGPVSLRVAGEVHEIGTTGELHALVRGLVGRVAAGERGLWMDRARAGWVFCQLHERVGPLSTVDAIGRQFGLHTSRVRSWMRLARRVVHAPSGEIDLDLVEAALAERDRERSTRAVACRKRGGGPAEGRSLREVEEAVGLRALAAGVPKQDDDAARTSGARPAGWLGAQMGFEDLFDLACDLKPALVEADAERIAGWLRDGDITRRVLDELGVAVDERADEDG